MPQPIMKEDFPVSNIRHFLEPGPIVLVSSQWRQQTNIMTMGWHTVMAFLPSLIGCVIAAGNHSHELVLNSGECVINIPAASLVDMVVGIGNCSGSEVDKFKAFGLTPGKASKVGAPLIEECYASFECRLYDDAMIEPYNLFIFEVVKAHAAPSADNEESLHYRGMGEFLLSGNTIDRTALFKPSMLV
ncbi:flavin reductase family protein [Halomonas sp. HL-93]|uniref:flavin reductase family protein n=1 Tax=Halomonas sp. HL-93 TaxID=1666906 RepID=UPI0006DB45C4|nr:flavin reductase family protein [Halomonas sp. HL-93]KPQ22649.1 MAG: DIM6/NTAB family protein [Halomonas sp. HL-93]SBR45440.1 NADH-FMN oxidoreductase RutF, flavin reductase (DIM6/NTAB) family [Halomonas sp. HL-93]